MKFPERWSVNRSWPGSTFALLWCIFSRSISHYSGLDCVGCFHRVAPVTGALCIGHRLQQLPHHSKKKQLLKERLLKPITPLPGTGGGNRFMNQARSQPQPAGAPPPQQRCGLIHREMVPVFWNVQCLNQIQQAGRLCYISQTVCVRNK